MASKHPAKFNWRHFFRPHLGKLLFFLAAYLLITPFIICAGVDIYGCSSQIRCHCSTGELFNTTFIQPAAELVLVLSLPFVSLATNSLNELLYSMVAILVSYAVACFALHYITVRARGTGKRKKWHGTAKL